MSDSQTIPPIELQAPRSWAQSLAEADQTQEQLEAVATAAAEARRRAAEGVTTLDLRNELKRSKRSRAWRRFGITVGVIVAIIAAAAIAVALIFSVNQVVDSSMSPTLKSGQIIISSKDKKPANGDVIAFSENGGVSFGRVVASPGDWVNITGDGSLAVTDSALDGSSASAGGQSSSSARISRQLPEGCYFVLGDSETATISGIANAEDFVTADQVIGKSLFKVWPVTYFGPVL